MKYNQQILKNVHSEVSAVYNYLRELFVRDKPIDKCFDEPIICSGIELIDGDKHIYDEQNYYIAQIRNKLTACTVLLHTLDFPKVENNTLTRQIIRMKYLLLYQIHNKSAYNEKKLNKLIITYPVDPSIPVNITEDFYNKLMEDVS